MIKALCEGPDEEADMDEQLAGRDLHLKIVKLTAALQQVAKGPLRPFPDPEAHSFGAYANAVHAELNRVQWIARNALWDEGDAGEIGEEEMNKKA